MVPKLEFIVYKNESKYFHFYIWDWFGLRHPLRAVRFFFPLFFYCWRGEVFYTLISYVFYEHALQITLIEKKISLEYFLNIMFHLFIS